MSGPSSSTTVSSAGGAYTFGNLGAGAYTLTASAAGLTFTPATVSVAVNGVAVTAASFTRVFPSTQQIADYMAILHSQSLGTFTTSEQALSNKLASQGLYGSGTHYVQSGQAYVAIVQTFVNGSLAFVQQKAQTMAIDRDAVAGQFTAYAAQDAAYASSYYSGVNWGLTGSGLATFIAGNNSSTNAAYALAVLQLP